MNINILHIDDEKDVLERAAKIVTGKEIQGHTLMVKDSLGFELGIEKLKTVEYDLIILDLCVGKATEVSDKIGIEIFGQIKRRAFIPIVFFTGLPDYVKGLESDIVRIAGKGDGYDALFSQISRIFDTKFIELKSEVNKVIREGVRSFFWDFVHPNKPIIEQLLKDEISLKYLLLRRLGKSLSSELTRNVIEDPNFTSDLSHPMEYYIYPPSDGEFETGDIVRHKKSGNISVICTPSCDLIDRGKGGRKADRVLLVHAHKFTSISKYIDYKAAESKIIQIESEGKQPSKENVGHLSNTREALYDLMGTKNERHFFLPQTPFIEASLVDFQYKDTVAYKDLEANFEIIASLDDPISQAVIAKYTRYYSRVGFRDLDIPYSFSKI